MIKQTFKTIKENPKMLWWHAIMFFAPLICILPFLSYIILYANNFEQATDGFMFGFFGVYLATLGLMMLVGLAVSIFVLPETFGYIYEACTDGVKKGWYKRNLKKHWWKIIVSYLISSVAVVFIYMISIPFIFMGIDHPVLLVIWYALFLVFAFAYNIFILILMTAVIAEENFGKALGNTFKVGVKYFWKMLGVYILIYLPATILSLMISGYESTLREASNEVFIVFGIFILVSIIYSIFTFSFLYTYSMHNYLAKRGHTATPLAEETTTENNVSE